MSKQLLQRVRLEMDMRAGKFLRDWIGWVSLVRRHLAQSLAEARWSYDHRQLLQAEDAPSSTEQHDQPRHEHRNKTQVLQELAADTAVFGIAYAKLEQCPDCQCLRLENATSAVLGLNSRNPPADSDHPSDKELQQT